MTKQRQESISSAVEYYTEQGYEIFERGPGDAVQMRKGYSLPDYTYVAIWCTSLPSDWYNGQWIEEGACYSEEY